MSVAAWLVLLLASAARAQDALPAAVQQALQTARLPADALAVAALPLQHDAQVYRHQAERPMQPGSAMKLVTSIVALDRLGPNHRGFTELRSAAAIDGATLQGDLVLRGGADAEFGVPQLWALLLELQAAGVRHIAGDVLIDRTRFRPARTDIGLPPFDEAPEFPYNVIPDALHLAGSLLPLRLQAGDDGVVRGTTVPLLDSLAIDSRMTLTSARCDDWDDHWQPATVAPAEGRTRITLRGAFPRGCTVNAALQLIDRAELTALLVRQVWQGLGGTLAGRVRETGDTPAPAPTRVLARRDARPWGELLRHLNKQSDNAWTRLLFLELGVPAMPTSPTTATTRDLADAAVRRWMREQRIDDAGLVLDNGSGLSRSERITPMQMAQLLRTAAAGRHAADLTMSLPTAGVDGTMRNRLKESPATGWARLKTGTLRNVVALAGYVRDAQGRPWAVAMMINHDDAARGRPVLDAFIDHIARHGLPEPARATGPQGEGP